MPYPPFDQLRTNGATYGVITRKWYKKRRSPDFLREMNPMDQQNSNITIHESIWDRIAAIYDETRICDRVCLNAALDYIVNRYPPDEFPRLLEPGIGTGRIAIPLAERCYKVEGVDPSKEMLSILRKRVAGTTAPPTISFCEADVTALPYPDGFFDIAIPVHLFYFVSDWKTAANELLRVVRHDGPVVLMHTGMGMEVPFLNDRYKKLCTELGYPIEFVGVTSTKEVIDYYYYIGCRVELIRDRWMWTSHIQLGKAIAYLRERAYSFTRVVPDHVHHATVKALEAEVVQRHGGLEVEVDVPNQVYLVILSRS